MDERKLTFIVVPHGDLETKTFEISYRKLRVLGWAGGLLLGVLVIMAAVWWTVAAQAARVPGLVNELKRFESERAKVDSLAQLLAKVEGQYEQVRKMLGADAPVAGQQPVLPDLSNEAKSTVLGPVVDAWPLGPVAGFITRKINKDINHPGLDIAVTQNSYIRAAGPGVVTEAGEDDVYGNFLRIDHGGGLESLYAHASRLLVAKGDSIERLQRIAMSGNTGKSTAPHLHFEIRQNGVPVDPLRFVKQP